MAYDKHTWTCNEPITVERLNHIEDGIAAGGDCDCGYECTETVTTLTEESVTTTKEEGDIAAFGDFSYSQLIDADNIKVTFDGVEYECEVNYHDGEYSYGASYDSNLDAYDWSEYPFAVSSFFTDSPHTTLATQAAGTYTIKIEVEEEIITTTPCFDKARGYSCGEEVGVLTEESVTTTAQGSINPGMLSYSQFIDADSITVTFDGVEYECPRIAIVGGNLYGGFADGAPDFSEYPFAISSSTQHGNEIITETAGTYSVKVEAVQETITTTSCFQKAVESLTSPLRVTLTKRIEDATNESPTETPEGSQSNIINALDGGRMVYLVDPDGHKYLVIGYSTSEGLNPTIEVMNYVDGVVGFNSNGSKFYYPQRQM